MSEHPVNKNYFALVLTPSATDRLLRSYATLPNRIAHHCTVAFGTDDPADLPEFFSPDDIGKPFLLRAIGYRRREDDAIEAVAVELLDDYGNPVTTRFSTNAIPHITLATDGRARPFEANALLAAGFEPVNGELLLTTLEHVRDTSCR